MNDEIPKNFTLNLLTTQQPSHVIKYFYFNRILDEMEKGIRMSQIARNLGICRTTLYKYINQMKEINSTKAYSDDIDEETYQRLINLEDF